MRGNKHAKHAERGSISKHTGPTRAAPRAILHRVDRRTRFEQQSAIKKRKKIDKQQKRTAFSGWKA